MKRNSWAGLGLTVLLLGGAAAVRAEGNSGLGKWSGSGAVYSPDGNEQGSFAVELTRKDLGGGTTETRGVVKPQGGGEPHEFWMKVTHNGSHFKLESANGKGGGSCYGSGLCESYEDDGNGHAFATTIITDGPEQMRLLVTELQDGKAVRMIRESLKLQR